MMHCTLEDQEDMRHGRWTALRPFAKLLTDGGCTMWWKDLDFGHAYGKSPMRSYLPEIEVWYFIPKIKVMCILRELQQEIIDHGLADSGIVDVLRRPLLWVTKIKKVISKKLSITWKEGNSIRDYYFRPILYTLFCGQYDLRATVNICKNP